MSEEKEIISEMARPMSRNGVTYTMRGGKYYKNEGFGYKEIDKEEYEFAKKDKVGAKTNKQVLDSIITRKKKEEDEEKEEKSKRLKDKPIISTKITKLDKPVENVIYLDERLYDKQMKKINTLNKKLIKAGLKPLDITVKDVMRHLVDIKPDYCRNHHITRENCDVRYPYKEVTIKLIYDEITSRSGYTFVGSIDHEENMVFCIYDDESVKKAMQKFRNRHVCDYCGTSRYRSKTAIFRNDETGELVQIGTKCLKDYIPINISDFLAVISLYANPASLDADFDSEDYTTCGYSGYGGSSRIEYGVDDVLARSVCLVKANGFSPSSNGESSSKMLLLKSYEPKAYENGHFIKYTNEDKNIVKDVKEWINKQSDNDFILNVKQIIKNGYCSNKTIGFLPAIVGSYYKYLAKQKELENNKKNNANSKKSEWVGNIGDKKVPMTLTLQSKSDFQMYINGYERWSTRYLFRDDKGNLIVCFTSSFIDIELAQTKKFTATIKDHKEFNGEKQTVVIRVKEVK